MHLAVNMSNQSVRAMCEGIFTHTGGWDGQKHHHHKVPGFAYVGPTSSSGAQAHSEARHSPLLPAGNPFCRRNNGGREIIQRVLAHTCGSLDLKPGSKGTANLQTLIGFVMV